MQEGKQGVQKVIFLIQNGRKFTNGIESLYVSIRRSWYRYCIDGIVSYEKKKIYIYILAGAEMEARSPC